MNSLSSAPMRDRGNTLIELLATVVIMGLIVTVLASGIAVIFRSEDGVGERVTEAHDLQQLVNYLPGDVEGAPIAATAYVTAAGGASGSGCSAAGSDNVLRIDDGGDSTAYRLSRSTAPNAVATLDRYRCSGNAVVDVVNIADHLIDEAGTPPAEAEVVLAADTTGIPEVDHVTVRLAQTDEIALVSGSPRAETQLVDAVVGGDCTAEPMTETLNFATFVRGDVRFTNNPQIKWASGIGGSLSFSENVSIGQNLNDDADLPTITPFGTALYVGKVDWVRSSGSLTMHSNRYVVINDRSNTTIATDQKSAYRLGGSTSNPKIDTNGQGRIKPIEQVIDFDNAFSVLRSCSVALAQLPNNSCSSCAVHLQILNKNGNGPYPGVSANTNMKLQLVSGKANVLNIRAADFAAMKNMSFIGASPSQSTPLIVNIIDTGNVVLSSYPQQGGIGDWVKSTLWNFPNATRVTLESGNDGVWGTVFAPSARVVSSVKIEGGVVADSWEHDAREVNGARVFTGQIDWNS